MSVEKYTIQTTRVRDKFGRPSCACDFATGEVCQYYRTQRFGTHETCILAPEEGRYGAILQRRTDSNGVPKNGTLIPGDWCPLWSEEERKQT